MLVFPVGYKLPNTMYLKEDVFSWDVWSKDNPPPPTAIPTIPKDARVAVVSATPYTYGTEQLVGILYRNRRYEVWFACLTDMPPTTSPSAEMSGAQLKEKTATTGIYNTGVE